MRVFGLKAQPVSVVEMVGKLRHPRLEAPLGSKQFVFATGHFNDGLGRGFAHGLRGQNDERHEVDGREDESGVF